MFITWELRAKQTQNGLLSFNVCGKFSLTIYHWLIYYYFPFIATIQK